MIIIMMRMILSMSEKEICCVVIDLDRFGCTFNRATKHKGSSLAQLIDNIFV